MGTIVCKYMNVCVLQLRNALCAAVACSRTRYFPQWWYKTSSVALQGVVNTQIVQVFKSESYRQCIWISILVTDFVQSEHCTMRIS